MVSSIFSGATALVTGGGGGIGRAIAVELGSHGAQVVVAGRRSAALAETVVMIERAGGRGQAHVGDLTDDGSTAELVRLVNDLSSGRLAVLVHCAAQHVIASVERMSSEVFDAAMKCNLRMPFLLTRSLLPALRSARGDIVFVNSSVVLNPRPELSAYAASKAALKAFADCLRAEVNADGVRVLSVFPGRTATPMQAELAAAEGHKYQPERLLQPESIAKATVDALSLARTAELTELHIRPAIKT
ncbi:MAG TPA: SDR family NAD(P)-dependent oxidoreductase [Steroidobacteraceae bacterium]|nr:SDR family NAD(P)-dependent oxidoreductase [Steroidobacteraceae bacterium]